MSTDSDCALPRGLGSRGERPRKRDRWRSVADFHPPSPDSRRSLHGLGIMLICSCPNSDIPSLRPSSKRRHHGSQDEVPSTVWSNPWLIWCRRSDPDLGALVHAAAFCRGHGDRHRKATLHRRLRHRVAGRHRLQALEPASQVRRKPGDRDGPVLGCRTCTSRTLPTWSTTRRTAASRCGIRRSTTTGPPACSGATSPRMASVGRSRRWDNSNTSRTTAGARRPVPTTS